MGFKDEIKKISYTYGSEIESINILIKYCQERCWDHWKHSEGRSVNHCNPEDAWGEVATANELLEFIKELAEKIEI